MEDESEQVSFEIPQRAQFASYVLCHLALLLLSRNHYISSRVNEVHGWIPLALRKRAEGLKQLRFLLRVRLCNIVALPRILNHIIKRSRLVMMPEQQRVILSRHHELPSIPIGEGIGVVT